MTDNTDAAGGEEESAAGAAELFGIQKADNVLPCILFERFQQLELKDVKKWLVEKTPMNKILWAHGKITKHGKAKTSQKQMPVISKLMYCWVQNALDEGRITKEELDAIVFEYVTSTHSRKRPPKDPVPSQPSQPSHPSTPTSPRSPSSPASVGSPTLTSDQVFNEYTETSVVLEQQEEEEESLDDGTNTGYSHINVRLKDAIFYTKNFNIENQIGACFKRILVLHKFYGKYSKAMVDDAMENGTVFPAIW
jgi:hypothetical protein